MPQGCGALGAYQEGVYQALHEAGIEPDWVIGTSIDAINASLIAGNPPERRVARLQAFWSQVEQHGATRSTAPACLVPSRARRAVINAVLRPAAWA